MRQAILRLRNNVGGQAIIETAISVMIVLPIFLWVLQMCMYCYTVSVFQYAARQGAQYAMTHGTDAIGCQGPGGGKNGQGCDATEAATKILTAGLVLNACGQSLPTTSVAVNYTNGTNNPGDPLTVTISNFVYVPSFHVSFITGFFPHPYLNVRATGNVLF